jgi:DNA recombination protein RmuC
MCLAALALVYVMLRINAQITARLDRMGESLRQAHAQIGQNLGNVTGIFGTLNEQIGRLAETNNQIIAISKDISHLDELLRVPKLRGRIGEMLLENLLSQVLPREYYDVQYRFSTMDAVDAVIRLGGKLVPVDAKFSLENFQKSMEGSSDQEKNQYRRKFIQDTKNRIDEIAAKYILPQENTYDFALMYVPAENVYYEVIIKEDLFSYCMAKKVIPVSPNTLYAYLQVICLGLKGLKIEEKAGEIIKRLGLLTTEMTKFREDFDLVGTHLFNAGRKYEDSQRRLEKFSAKLNVVQEAGSPDTSPSRTSLDEKV